MHADPIPADGLTVRLVPKRIERANAFRHLVAGLTLIMGAVDQIGAGHVSVATGFVLLAGIGLAVVVVIELKRPHLIHGRRVGFVDLAAALAEFAHAAELAELGKRALPLTFVFLGLVFLSIALFESKLKPYRPRGPRYIRLDPDELTIRFNLLRRVVLPWRDVRRAGFDGDVFTAETTGGAMHRVDLDRMAHTADQRATLTAALARFAPTLTDPEPT